MSTKRGSGTPFGIKEILDAIEANLDRLDELEAEYDRIPSWRLLKQRKNLAKSLQILGKNRILWAMLEKARTP